MGLAERFKDRLKEQDLFKNSNLEQELQNNEITFISKPVQENSITETTSIDFDNKFEDLETEIISKIRRTPYWEDYSLIRKENMISGYFNAKIKTSKYSEIEYSDKDKENFVKNIISLTN